MTLTVKQIVLDYLAAHGYDCLRANDGDCWCTPDELKARGCCNFPWDCVPGRLAEAKATEGKSTSFECTLDTGSKGHIIEHFVQQEE